jgi:tetratricopeptide (TPR) repeat protein
MLFQERARAVLPGFQVTRDNAPAVARICAALDGLPLALELAAPRLRVLSAHHLAERIEGSSGRLSLLRSGPRDAPSRHQTLRDAIDWSYRMLAPEEQRELAALSVFAGGFTPESAEEITGVPRSLELIESLVEKNLLQAQAQVDPRFSMLETVREFASEMLDQFEDGPALRRRHAEWFGRLAAQQSGRVQGRYRAEAITIFSHERANLRVALRWAVDQRLNPLAEGLALALLRFWEATAQFSEARQWLELVLAEQASGRALSALGWIDFHQGRHQDARRHLRDALSLHSAADPLGARAETLVRMQWAALNEGDYRAVEETVEESVAGCLAAGDAVGAAMARVQRAMVRAAAGEHVVAREEFDGAIDALTEEGAEEALGWALNAAGDAARVAGDLETCERRYRRALEIGERLGSDRVWTAAMINLGLAAATRRDFDEALKQTQRALRVQVAQGRRDTLPGALLILSLKHVASGRVAEGARLLAAAEQMQGRLGQRWEYGDRDLVAIASDSMSRLDPQERAAAEAAASTMDEEQIRREIFE